LTVSEATHHFSLQFTGAHKRHHTDLVETFGTHFVQRAYVGGQLTQSLVVDKCFFATESTSKLISVVQLVSQSVGIKALANLVKPGIGLLVPKSFNLDTGYNSTSVSISRPATRVLQAAASATEKKGGSDTADSASSWATSVAQYPPVVIQRSLAPIETLFFGAQRAAVRAAVVRRLSSAAAVVIPPTSMENDMSCTAFLEPETTTTAPVATASVAVAVSSAQGVIERSFQRISQLIVVSSLLLLLYHDW